MVTEKFLHNTVTEKFLNNTYHKDTDEDNGLNAVSLNYHIYYQQLVPKNETFPVK